MSQITPVPGPSQADFDALNGKIANKANIQTGQLATAQTTLTFNMLESGLMFVSRTTSNLSAIYAVDTWGVMKIAGNDNLANITVSGTTVSVSRGSSLNGNAFVRFIT